MIKVDNITIAIFTKLLAISIVANNFLGLVSKSKTLVALGFFSEFKDSLSLASMEKKATSEPETSAELISKITITASAIITGIDIGLKINSSPGKGSILSGSNCN